MSAARAAILEGMPEPCDLRMHHVGGRCVITAGPVVLFEYDADDLLMRNMALVTLRQLKFSGGAVAQVLGLTGSYVATLFSRAKRDGSAALAGQQRRGRPDTVTAQDWELARQWRAAGVSDAEIGRRLGVANTTIGRRLGQRGQQGAGERAAEQAGPLFTGSGAGHADADPDTGAAGAPAGPAAEQEPDSAVPGDGPEPLIREGVIRSRYAGAMLLHAFLARTDAGTVLGGAGRSRRDTALLTAVSMGFALGQATIEQFKHLTASDAGPLAGLGTLPGLRALRPELAAIADRTDPLALQAAFATSMLAADPVVSGVYYVDDHFIPYTGAKPVAKGWNNKRGRAERGRADTHVTAHDGRAVCFVSGEPSGLSLTLPKALAELKKAVPPGTPVMIGFDRGGAYAQVFTHCREQGVRWVSYRRAPLAVPVMLPVTTTVTIACRTRQITWSEEEVQLKDYGAARQITLFEHGQVALQVLTSDTDACPAEILSWLRSRWREENFLKYASENYGTGKICDYLAGIETNTKILGNPARKKANTAIRDGEKTLAAAERDLATLIADPAISVAAKNTTLIPAAQRTITAARKKRDTAVTARDAIPAKLPANVIDPDAEAALLRAGRRSLQMILRLLAHNAEHWLSDHLNAYLRDDDEYRAITRESIIRALAGTITFTSGAITVELERPRSRRVALALALLIDEISHTPPVMPGDHRPITYKLTAHRDI